MKPRKLTLGIYIYKSSLSLRGELKMQIRKTYVRNVFFFMIICLTLFNISFSLIPSIVLGEEISEVITTDTVYEGDLELSGNSTLTIENCIYNVTGSTTIRDQARLILINATFNTMGLELYDSSLLKMASSTYGWGIKAHGYSMVTIIGSSLPPVYGPQFIELNDASLLRASDSASLYMFVVANDQSDVGLTRCGPDINIQTGQGSSLVGVRESMINGLTVFGNSQVYAANSILGDVFVAHQGLFIAESSVIVNSIGYYDYHSTILLSDSQVNYLIDGIIYEDQSLAFSGENIMIGNYSTGVELINCNVTETKYILFLLGEDGQYHLRDLTSDVLRVLVESSNVTAEAINSDDLVFFIGREASLYIRDSTFNVVIAQATWALILEDCRATSISFGEEMIQLLRIINSTIISPAGPAVIGGWATNMIIESSIIRSNDFGDVPDMAIIYLNQLILRDSSDIELEGDMAVMIELYNSDTTFSRMQIEGLHNNLNSSRVELVNGASYSKYTTQPPNLIVQKLEVAPRRVKPGESILVSAEISNEGEILGGDTFILHVDGEAIDETSLFLAGGASKSISFTINEAGLGKHVAKLDGIEKRFIVSNLSYIEMLFYTYGPVVGVVVLIIGVVLYLKMFRGR